MSSTPLLLIYCALIVAASVLGGLLPILIRLTHTRLQVIISLTAGFMLGVAMLHMIPHALDSHGPYAVEPMSVMITVLVGFLVTFFIERFFSSHTHTPGSPDASGSPALSSKRLSWAGAAIGLTLHSLIAGVALGSAVASESGPPGTAGTALAGLAVFLVIVSHKPLDALTVITLTAAAGFAKPTRHLANGLFALAVPLGVVLFGLGLSQTTLADSGAVVSLALAFSAGTFLCIALSDLLPELHFHSHDRLKLTLALVVGVMLAYAMAMAEHSMHNHDAHGHGNHAGHGHDQHDDHTGHSHDRHENHESHEGHDHGDHDGHNHGSTSKDAWTEFFNK